MNETQGEAEVPKPVEIGQRYEDTDKRYPGRVVEVIAVDLGTVKAQVVSSLFKKKTWIRFDRLQNPKHYKLLGKKKTEV